MIDKFHVITLDRTPERYAEFLRLNPHLPTERFTAVDGRTITREYAIEQGILSPRSQYGLGRIGSAMSHFALWERCVAARKPIHISEDDIIFRRDFIPTAEALIAELADWDVILWTVNADWPFRCHFGTGMGGCCVMFDPDLQKAEMRDFAAATTQPILVRLHSAASIGAYSVTPHGAARLLALCKPVGEHMAPYPIRPHTGWTNTGLDVEMSRHYPVLNAFVSLPLLAVAPNDDSTINEQLDAANASPQPLSVSP